ncbi:MAG: hypothetical protein R2792_02550 [Saprospiraceae bacterium]
MPNKAIVLFEKSVHLVKEPKGFDLFCMANCYAHQKQKRRAYKFLKQAIKQNILPPPKAISSKPFSDVLSSKQQAKAIARCNKKLIELESDPTQQRLLDSVYYYLYNDAFWYGGNNKKAALKRGEKYIDSTLTSYSVYKQKLVNFIQNNGYIGSTRVGTELISIPVIHLDYDHLVQLESTLEKEFESGHILPYDYGSIKSTMEKHQSGNYCAYFLDNPKCGAESIETVVKNRTKVGMSIYLDGDDYNYKDVFSKRRLLFFKTQY